MEKRTYQEFVDDIVSGSLDEAQIEQTTDEIMKEDVSVREELAEELHAALGQDIKRNIYLYSLILNVCPKAVWLSEFAHMVYESDEFGWQELYFLYWQMSLLKFRNSSLADGDKDSIFYKILEKSRELCKRELTVELAPIPVCERNEKLAVVFIAQYLAEEHGPTKTVLDRAWVLQKKLGKRVLIVNTAELMPMTGAVPYFGGLCANYIPSLLEVSSVSWKGEEFQYYQCVNDMPNVQEMQNLLLMIKRLKPSAVVCVGGASLLVGLVDELIPVLTVATTPSDLVDTLSRYQVVDTYLHERIREPLANQGKTMEHVIPGIFTFSLKEQTESVARQDFGIPEDAFVIAMVGGRLGVEMDRVFWDFLACTLKDKERMLAAVIGGCDNFDDMLAQYPDLQGRVLNFGFCSDVLSRLELCDLYVNPTRRGGGTSVVEAMFKGLPAVSVNYGDVAWIIGEDFCCKDYDEMGRLLERYYTDSEFYDSMSEKAEKLVNMYLDSEAEFARIMREYAVLVNKEQ